MAQHMNMSGQNDGVFTSQRNQEYWSSIFLGLGTCEYLSCDDELTEKCFRENRTKSFPVANSGGSTVPVTSARLF